ncbi:hypothetical protein SRB5_01990 [Streptomyces sp. RB5]|uniref:Chemotaxis protein n=1 Tax=Streptomyces smaragdinus TaxID=2585196 RepID=A0A7K0C9F8_9ACTN|nr:chemotaxis protein [Streptomyces smaragdinus]MQY10095.1 hypothetical protein [Streptomyces smaragdinus]
MLSSLTSTALQELRRPRTYPAVSLVMPTHPRRAENAQDQVRLRNLVAEATRRLEADGAVGTEQRRDVTAQLEQAVGEVDPAQVKDGLVIFAAPGEHQVWAIDREVPERVVLSQTFLTRNLVAADAAHSPYWVVTPAADRVSLFEGHGDHVTEITGRGFPLTRSLEDPDVERKQRIGDVPSTYSDEQTRQFFRDADTALAAVLATDPRPLYLAAEPPALALFTEVGGAAKDAAQVTVGGLAHAGAEAVARAVEPARAASARIEVAEANAALERARGGHTYAAGVDEVWSKALDGRVHELVVEEDYRTSVHVGDGHLEPADAGDPEAVHDIIDEIIESSLETGAQVVFVPDGTLTEAGHIAAVLRY